MTNTSTKLKLKVAIYGGNGFVGTHIAKALTTRGISVVCLSRTGHKPIHLVNETWSESVRWCKGDASSPSLDCLKQVDVVISTVGSPPIPTFSQEAYDKQLFANGTSNVQLIETSLAAGIKRLVIIGANIPWPLNRDSFAYAKGKKMAFESAEKFSQHSSDHCALVLQPGTIMGKRFTTTGKCIPLDTFLGPLGMILPGQFVSVERIANRITDELLTPSSMTQNFKVIKNRDI